MKSVISFLFLIGCLISCDNGNKYKYIVYSIKYDVHNTKDEIIMSDKLNEDTVFIEYVKNALKYTNPDKVESVLVKVGDSDLYEYSGMDEKVKVFAPKGLDTLQVDMETIKSGHNIKIAFKLTRVK